MLQNLKQHARSIGLSLIGLIMIVTSMITPAWPVSAQGTVTVPPETVPQICQNKTTKVEETIDTQFTLNFTLDVVVPDGAQLTGWRFWHRADGRAERTISNNTFLPGHPSINHTLYKLTPGKYGIDVSFIDTDGKDVTQSCEVATWILPLETLLPMILDES